MLDCVDARVAPAQGRRAIVFDHVLHACLDFRLAFEVHAPEPDAGIGRRRQKGHRHPAATVQANAGKGGGTVERLLL